MQFITPPPNLSLSLPPVAHRVKRDLFSWARLGLSQLDKAQVGKTYALLKINPTPDAATFRSIESSIIRFMNRNTYFRTNNDLIFRNRKYGGLGTPWKNTH